MSALYTLPTMIGLIDIAFHEIHDHFLADARNVDRAPLLARPERGHAHPAGAVDVVLCPRGPNGTGPSRGRTCRGRSPRRTGPTTVAVCTPRTLGTGVTRAGRKGSAEGMQVKRLSYLNSLLPIVHGQRLLGIVLHAGEHELAVVGEVAG